jgi:hypothetical protein
MGRVERFSAYPFGLDVIYAECDIHSHDEFVYTRDIEDIYEIIAIFWPNISGLYMNL